MYQYCLPKILKKLLLIISLLGFTTKLTAQKHPYLIFTNERIEVLKKRIKSDTAMAANWQELRAAADGFLIKGNVKDNLDYLSVVWLVTGEKKYADKIKEVLLKLCSRPSWANEEMLKRKPAWLSDLETARNCWAVAIGFDAIYDQLDKEEKRMIVEGVVRMGIKTALDDWLLADKRIHTLNSMGHNWWSACVGSAGIAALAIKGEHPEAENWAQDVANGMEEWYRFNGDILQNKPKTIDQDGGMYESVGYASFGIQQFLLFNLAFKDTYPHKKQPLTPGLGKIADWFCQVSYPREGALYSLNFGDSEVHVAGESVMKLLYALGEKNPNIRWYIDQVKKRQHRDIWFANTPMGIIIQPDMEKVPSVPNLPTAALYEDMDWATMRNSWQKDETMLGVKSGYTWNHSHADANSFILFHKGEDIIKDAGNSWYGSQEYPAYFFQSEAHNVAMFNGKAQPKEQQYNGSPVRGQLSDLMDGGHIKYILANGVGPTALNFTRNFRSFIWLDKVIIIVDDLKAHETGKFSWRLHPGGTSKKIGGDISISHNKSSVLVRPLFPETLVQTGFDHDFPEKMKLTEISAPKARDPQHPTEIHYVVEYPREVKETKFITAIILKDSLNDKNLPVIERLESLTMNGLKITQDGKVTELYLNLPADGHIMHLNSVNNFGGWDTDAYLFGFSYPEKIVQPQAADITDYFMAYGSYFRRDRKTLFSSLSKLNLIAEKSGEKFDLILQGQPFINAAFSLDRKPAVFSLNHKTTTPVFQNKTLQIRIDNAAK
jgi:hypothetical protein